jgi:hypothetical protein
LIREESKNSQSIHSATRKDSKKKEIKLGEKKS